MVDGVEQLDLIDTRLRRAASRTWRRCGCASTSTPAGAPLGGRMRVGAKRSPVHTPEQAAALARAILARDALRLVGIMAYEAQIAGVGDAPPGPSAARAARSVRCSRAPRASSPRVARDGRGRRRARRWRPLEFVNGGGTGSLRAAPPREPAVTELDRRLRAVRPGAVRRLPRVHAPSRRAVRAARRAPARARRGRPCSAAATSPPGPPTRARLPRPHLPAGLRLDSPGGRRRGADAAARRRRRRARGRRSRLAAPRQGRRAVRALRRACTCSTAIGSSRRSPTYRGEGQCFL